MEAEEFHNQNILGIEETAAVLVDLKVALLDEDLEAMAETLLRFLGISEIQSEVLLLETDLLISALRS